MYRLENEHLAVAIDDRGRLIALENKRSGKGNVIARPGAGMYRMVARIGSNWENAFLPEEQRCAVSRRGASLVIEIDQAVSDGSPVDIGLRLAVTLEGRTLRFDATITNRSEDALVTDLFYPVIGDVRSLAGGRPDLLWPNHLGERITNITGSPGATALTYPGGHGRGASMQWMALCEGDQTLSLSGRDREFYSSQLRAIVDPADTLAVRLEMLKLPFARPGETWCCPPYVLSLYTGKWHEAADEYRSWASSWRATPDPPRWVRDMQGYFLVINKQQYGEELWPYDTLPELYRHAVAHGCDTLGLFGWYEGGHDNTYPELAPSPGMGGAEGLRDGIASVRGAGGRVTLYFQGHLLDLGTEYYRRVGHRLESKSRWGTPYFEQYNKSHMSGFLELFTAKSFSNACPSCPEWQERMEEAVDCLGGFGPDGILFDQIGGMLPYPCFDDSHPHAQGRPSLSCAPGRIKLLERIRRRTRERDPELAFLTEHITDVYSGYADLLHGMYARPDPRSRAGRRAEEPSATLSYPELFRYTFPETIATIRNPHPFIGRRQENYAFLFGLRKEMELRYLDDRNAIREDRHPVDREYSRQVTAFRRASWDLMGHGTFVDDRPLRPGNPAILAKAFSAGDRLGVALWNDSDGPEPLELEVPHHELVEVLRPEGKADAEPPWRLGSQQIALAVYRRRG